VTHGSRLNVSLRGSPDAIAISSVDRYGIASDPNVVGRR